MIEVPFSVIAGSSFVVSILLLVLGIYKGFRTIIIIGLIICSISIISIIGDINIPYKGSFAYLRTESTTSRAVIEPWFHDDSKITTVKSKNHLITYPTKLVEIHPTTDEPYETTTMSRQFYSIKCGKIYFTAHNSYIITAVDIYLPQSVIPPQS